MVAAEKIRDQNFLKQFSLLEELDSERLAELIEGAELRELKKGQSVSAVTEKTQIAYLLSGEVICSPGAAGAERIKAGSGRARQPLLTPAQRVRVLAESDVTLLCVDSDLLDILRSWGSSNGLVVDEIDTSDSGEWVESLMQSDAVLNLPPSSIQALMSSIDPVERKSGTEIFRQGDEPDYYYIISRGRCRVSCRRNGDKAPHEIAVLESGEAFGEEALIANTPRGATVTMLEDGLLLRLDRDTFKKLLEQPMVRIIGSNEADRIRAAGGVVIDLRPANEFARDGRGLNIPFSELRSEIDSLSRNKHYIVVSDDNRTSAVAAFLLGQKQLNVSVLQTAAREEVAAQAAEATAQARELQAEVERLQQQLAAAQQQQNSSQTQLEKLETELRDTQKSARSAIVEASVLKNRSEAMLRNRISELSSELEQEKQQQLTRSGEAERLRSELAALQQQLTTMQVSANQDEQQQLLQQLQQEQIQLQASHTAVTEQLRQQQQQSEAAEHELDTLQQQLNDVGNRAVQAEAQCEELNVQKNALQAELTARETALRLLTEELHQTTSARSQLEESIAALQVQKSELQTIVTASQAESAELQQQLEALQHSAAEQQQQQQAALESLQLQRQTQDEELARRLKEMEGLSGRIDELQQQLQQRDERLADLDQQFDEAQQRAEQAEEQLNTLHGQHLELQESQERSLQVIHQAREQIKQLEQTHRQLEQRLEQQQRRAQKESEEAKLAGAMQDEKIKSLKALMVEKQTHHKQVEASSQEQQKKLESALKKSAAENEKLRDESTKEQLRNKILSEELSRLQNENRRSGLVVKLQLLFILVVVAAVGVAYYMGIDFQGLLSSLIESVEPAVKPLLELIPKP